MIDFILISIKQGGWMLLPIYLVSVWAWILAVRIYFRLWSLNLGSSKINRFRKDPSLVSNWVSQTKGKFVADTIHGALLHKLHDLPNDTPFELAEEYAEEIMRWKLPETEKEIGLLGGFAGVAPLLGLLGTVTGMIGTFDVISAFGTSNPAFMADSISVALITTQDALVVALPLLIIHTFLSNKRRRIEDTANQLLKTYILYRFPKQGSTAA